MANYVVEHRTTGTWTDTGVPVHAQQMHPLEDLRVVDRVDVERQTANTAEVLDDAGLAAFLAKLQLRQGEVVRIERDDARTCA